MPAIKNVGHTPAKTSSCRACRKLCGRRVYLISTKLHKKRALMAHSGRSQAAKLPIAASAKAKAAVGRGSRCQNIMIFPASLCSLRILLLLFLLGSMPAYLAPNERREDHHCTD